MIMVNYARTAESTQSCTLGADSWSETALDWWQRSRQQVCCQPKDPAAAARAYCQQPSVAFLQQPTTIRRRRAPLPLVELCGEMTAQRDICLSLAAQFVVQTRPSRFAEYNNNNNNALLPRVFLLDAHWEMTLSVLHKWIRAQLLCDYDNLAAAATNHDEQTLSDTTITNDLDRLAADMESCLQRVHIANADENNSAGWLPILESLEAHLAQATLLHPTLVLWDGLLGGKTLHYESSVDDGGSTEIPRTLLRLLRDYQVMLVYTTTKPLSTHKKGEWDERVTHRVRLEKMYGSSSQAFVAHTQEDKDNPIPFFITSVGVKTT